MLSALRHIARSARGAVLLFGLACAPEPPAEPATDVPLADTLSRGPLYTRELLFVGQREGEPVVVPFVFTALEQGELHDRSARAWLGHAGEWDAFLDHRWSTPAAAGVWRVVPHGDLRVVADDMGELEALVYRRGDRTLRLAPGPTISTFSLRDEVQYRLHRGRLEIGGQPLGGAVLEVFEMRETAGGLEFAGAQDWLFASDGVGVHLLVAETMGAPSDAERTFAWLVLPDGDGAWERAEIRWLEMRPIEQARRDAPIRWSFRVPEAELEGEVASTGFELELGPDRAGRRSLKLRHSVEGWLVRGEERHPLVGLLRHSQE